MAITPASLRVALAKQADGRGLKNSEISALRHFERAKVFPPAPRSEARRISEGDTRTEMDTGKDRLYSSNGAVGAAGAAGAAGATGETGPPGSPPADRFFSSAISVAGVVPTSAEISAALVAAYSGAPANNDYVILTVGGIDRFCARVSSVNPGVSGLFRVSFVVSSITYYAVLNQLGIY